MARGGAPGRPGANRVDQEAYSHEVISHGFWPGNVPGVDASFYAYAAPEPAGFREAKIEPAAAYYSKDLSIFLLPYETVRRSQNPALEINSFFNSTYDTAANLAKWNRAELERR